MTNRAFLALSILIALVAFAGGMMVMDNLKAVPAQVTVIAAARPAPQPYFLPLEFSSDVIYYCDETGVPVWIACRLFDTEAWFNPHPRPSSAGAIGMGQFMPSNLAEFSRRYNDGRPIDVDDQHTVVRVTIRHLADLYAQKGDWRLAVGSYNAGPYSDPAAWKDETVRYVRSILRGVR